MKTMFGLFIVLLMVFPAMADSYTYTYTGNPFEWYSPPYSASNFISGYFTTAAPLAANLHEVRIDNDILSFSFTDGSVNTITSPLVGLFNEAFFISTDSHGDITAWDIGMVSGDWTANPPTNIGLFTCKGITDLVNSCPTSFPGYDESYLMNGKISSVNVYHPGTWTVNGGVEAPVPEPSSFVLLGGVVLVAIRVIKRRCVCN